MKLEQSFEVAAPIEQVWEALIDIERVAPCLPGAAVTGRNDDGTYNGTFTIKIGPDHRVVHRQARDGERRRDAHTRDDAGPGERQAGAGRRQGDDRLEAVAGWGVGDAGRGRHRLPHHRTPGAVRARGDDRGHLRAAAARVRERAAVVAGRGRARSAGTRAGSGCAFARGGRASAPPPPPPPPPPASEPLDGLSLVRSAIADRVRQDLQPLLAALGVLLFLRFLRRRRSR